MTVLDLTRIKDEFEQIYRSYRTTFTLEGRLSLIQRVKDLVWQIEKIKRVEGNKDARDDVSK